MPLDAAWARGEASEAAAGATVFDLTLFVSGASDLSAIAIANARELCDTHLAGRHQLAVVDVHEDVTAVFASQVLATPTLVRNRPEPVRKVVGDLSRTETVLAALGITAAAGSPMVNER